MKSISEYLEEDCRNNIPISPDFAEEERTILIIPTPESPTTKITFMN